MSDRDQAWHRRRRVGERWPRFCADIPPALADALIAAQRASLGVNYDGWRTHPTNATKANLVTSALRLYLNTTSPEPEPAIDSTAVEIDIIIDRPQLEKGD
jgi:hypothetical protein